MVVTPRPLSPLIAIHRPDALSKVVVLQRRNGAREVYRFHSGEVEAGGAGLLARLAALRGDLFGLRSQWGTKIEEVVELPDGFALVNIARVGSYWTQREEVVIGGLRWSVLPHAEHGWETAPVGWRPKTGWKILAVSPGLERLVTTGKDQHLKIWDVAAQSLVPIDLTSRPPNKVTLSPDGAWLATCERPGVVRVWDARTGSLVASREVDHPGVRDPCFTSPTTLQVVVDGQQLSWAWCSAIVLDAR